VRTIAVPIEPAQPHYQATKSETTTIELTLEHQPMKWIPGIKSKFLAHSFAAILLGSAALVSAAGPNSDAVVQTAGGVSYVSGGVGEESINRLTSFAGDFNLKLVFALTSGAYVSDVRVAIADKTGRTLLDATSEGPWFLTKLPAGNYQVVATFAGKAVTQHISIGTEKLRTLDFRWATE
jgi:hypothetical protein